MIKLITCLSVGALVAGGFYYFGRDVRDDTTWVENERYRLDIQHQIELTTMRLGKRDRGPDAGILEKAVAARTVRKEQLAALRKAHVENTAALQKLETAFGDFREQRLADLRERALGSEWEEFVSLSGRVLKDAKVISIDDCGVMLRHRDGSARMRYQDLTEEQRYLFGLEEESAVAAISEEHKRAHAYESWVTNEMDAREIGKLRELADNSRNSAQYRFRKSPMRNRYTARPEIASADASPLKIGSLDTPPRKVNENPRYRMRSSGSNYYYNYSVPSQSATLPTGGSVRRWQIPGGTAQPSSMPSGGTARTYSSAPSAASFQPVSTP